MSQVTSDYRWRIVKHSQIGSSHLRQALRNQDAVGATPDGPPPIVLAVADGHGSPRSFRSETGAQFAVETAVELCRDFLVTYPSASPTVHEAAKNQLPGSILKEWRQRVTDHLNAHPITKQESDRLKETVGEAERDRPATADPGFVMYGSTLLAVLVGPDYLVGLQLGDGEILAVSDAYEVTSLVPRDDSLIANETTSLCQNPIEAKINFRCAFKVVEKSPPNLILLTTDGYPNSFASREGFLKAGSDFLHTLRDEGVDCVAKAMPEWLEDASRNGSGDDVTVGLLWRCMPLPIEEGRPARVHDLDAPGAASTPQTASVTPDVERISDDAEQSRTEVTKPTGGGVQSFEIGKDSRPAATASEGEHPHE